MFEKSLMFYLETGILLFAFIIMLIIYFLPKKRKAIIKIHSSTTIIVFKSFFLVLLVLLIIFNFFIYFAQPTYNNKIMWFNRKNKNVVVKNYSNNKNYRFSSDIYKILNSDPDKREYRKITNWIWENIFFINNSIILILCLYVLFLNVFFNIKIFRVED